MIRFAWLQFRMSALVVFGALVAVGAAFALTGPHLVHLFHTTVATCNTRGDCPAATAAFVLNDRLLQDLGNVLILVPALIGVFWGAPLVARELEAGTHRLVWTQGITRTRWLAAKLGLVGIVSVAIAGIFSLMMTWWSSPIDRVNMNQFTTVFDQRDVVPVGYAAFAFALGVTAGMLIRRTLPAMAATLAVFAAVRVAIAHWIRPHLMSPVHKISALHMTSGMSFEQTNNGPLSVTGAKPGGWVFSDQLIDKAGHPVAGSFLDHGACLQSRGSPACIGNLRDFLVYQPAGRYWAFQWYEMAIYIGLALVLGGLCFWWIRHQLS
jgi:hypothetical protein